MYRVDRVGPSVGGKLGSDVGCGVAVGERSVVGTGVIVGTDVGTDVGTGVEIMYTEFAQIPPHVSLLSPVQVIVQSVDVPYVP